MQHVSPRQNDEKQRSPSVRKDDPDFVCSEAEAEIEYPLPLIQVGSWFQLNGFIWLRSSSRPSSPLLVGSLFVNFLPGLRLGTHPAVTLRKCYYLTVHHAPAPATADSPRSLIRKGDGGRDAAGCCLRVPLIFTSPFQQILKLPTSGLTFCGALCSPREMVSSDVTPVIRCVLCR